MQMKAKIENGESLLHHHLWNGCVLGKSCSKKFSRQVEIVDLRTLFPLDEEMIFESVKRHGKCLVLTEEQQNNSFAEALAGRISKECFKWLDGPVEVLGAANIPAIPLNIGLENAVLPNAEKVSGKIRSLFAF